MSNFAQIFYQKKLLIGIGGSIAAVKTASLVKTLLSYGAKCQVIVSHNAQRFIPSDDWDYLKSNTSIYQDLFEEQNPMRHIELTRWADAFLIAPASADNLSDLACGRASSLLLATALASACSVWIAPAMNTKMWLNPQTQSNVSRLKASYRMIEPTEGELACGEVGLGRLPEVEGILAKLAQFFKTQQELDFWSKKRVLITAGATMERIDEVRFLSNFSSGKMAQALCEVLVNSGAELSMVCGRVEVDFPSGVRLLKVESAQQMLQACLTELKENDDKGLSFDYFFGVAAVCDFQLSQTFGGKIKKSNLHPSNTLNLSFKPTSDIIKTISHHTLRPHQMVGFCAESENLENYALEKIERKNLDWVVANPIKINHNERVMGSDNNQIKLFKKGDKTPYEFGYQSKQNLSFDLLQTLARLSNKV